jgi:hypothetical protein
MPFVLTPRKDIAHGLESQRTHHVNVLMNIMCGSSH